MPANRLTPSERSLVGRIGAHKSWGNTEDRSARTSKPRKAFDDKFLIAADGDPQRAASLRKHYFAELALKSAQARKRRAAGGSGR